MFKNTPVNSTMQELDSYIEDDAERLDSHSRISRTSRRNIAKKNPEFDDKGYDDYWNEYEDNSDYNDTNYDDPSSLDSYREIVTISRINKKNDRLVKAFNDKYPTSIKIPTSRILTSSSSSSSLNEEEDLEGRFESRKTSLTNNTLLKFKK